MIDLLAVWRPRRLRPVDVGEVEAYVEQACREYRAPLIADYHQAAQLTQALRARGLTVRDEHFSPAGNAKRAAVMAGMLRDRRLGLPDDEELIEELAGLILIERSPGQFRIDHRPGKHDDRAQAIALVASELAHERKRARARSQPAPQGLGGSAPGWMYGGSQHDGGSDDHRRWVRWRWQETGEHPCPECERERAEAEAVARSREGRADAAASDRLVRFLSDRARPGGKGGQVEMTDRAARAVQRLRTEVEARVGPLHEVEAPKTPAEARKLAREDSELFSALFEAGRLTPEALGAKEGRK